MDIERMELEYNPENVIRISLGKMLKDARICQNLTWSGICHHICSKNVYFRMEKENFVEDALGFNAILERIGMFPVRFHMLLSQEENQFLVWKMESADAVRNSSVEDIRSYIGRFHRLTKLHSVIKAQWEEYLTYVICVREHGHTIEAFESIKRAVEYTMGDPYALNIPKQALGSEEIQLLLMYLSEELFLGKRDRAEVEKFLTKLRHYLQNKKLDSNNRAMLLSRITAMEIVHLCGCDSDMAGKLAGESANEMTKMPETEMLSHVQETAACMKHNAVLCDMPLFLGILAAYGEDEKVKIQSAKQGEALLMLYQQFGNGYRYRVEDIYFIVPKIAEIGEFLRFGRKAKGLSQERLSEEICAVENYSRIENGKIVPHGKNLKMLLNKLGLEWGCFGSVIITESFEEQIKRVDAEEALRHDKVREYKNYLDKLEKTLDMSIVQNRQYIGAGRIAVQMEYENVTGEEQLNQLWKYLEMTRASLDTDRLYGINEQKILLHLARGCRRLGNLDMAEKVITAVVANESRKRFPDIHTIKYFERTLAGVYCDLQMWENEENIAKKWLQMIFAEGWEAGLLEQFLDLIAEAKYKKTPEDGCAKELLAAAVYMADLYEEKQNAGLLRTGYASIYDAQESWY